MKKLIAVFLIVGLFTAVIASAIARPVLEVRGKTTAVQISGQMTPEQQLAQELALADARVQAYTDGHRAELFGVRGVIAGQYTEAAGACAAADCRQVEIYLWDTNVALSVLVNIETQEVLDVLYQPGMHPGINRRLHDLSMDIALNAPEVIEALGYRPTRDMVLAAVDANLLGSSCEGEHLCVGPTFATEDGRILWAVVDLTSETLAGIAWDEASPPGDFEPFVPTGCPAPGSVSRDGWTLDYATTAWDSLNVSNIAYNGISVATGIKLVEWHVHYPNSGSGFVDSTGCNSGGGGFSIFPYGETEVLDLLDDDDNVIGFEVVQDFRMGSWGSGCNYRYEQRMRFYADGSFRPVSAAYGKGCQQTGVYRPVVRINIAVNGDANDRFSRWDGGAWQVMTTEDYLVPYVEAGHGPHHLDPNGFSWKIEDTLTGFGYYIVQDVGQFDGQLGRGDNPFLYPTLHNPAEGDTDLGVIGTCCASNHQQGPHNYLNGENIDDANIVLWYVSQATTDVTPGDYYCWTISGEPNPETYPCFMGPLFVPFGDQPPTASFTHNLPIVLGGTAVFTNSTSGTEPITYTWNFGDSSPISTEANPTHLYAAAGDYTVTLTATNNLGFDVFATLVSVGITPTAVFTHPLTASTFELVQFTDQSQGTPPLDYEWDFGDGSAATDQNPTHVYTQAGVYTITLTVSSDFGSDTAVSSITIDDTPVPPAAAFSHILTATVNQPVDFTNLTTGTPPISYTWDFGDGSAIVTDTHPSHIYTATGTFTVTLTATNTMGSDTAVSSIVIEPGVAPTTAFTHTLPAFANAPVVFTNLTTGSSPISYLWDFGDGSAIVTDTHPSHVYTATGTYTVTLRAINDFGGDTAVLAVEVIEGYFINLPVILKPEESQ